MMKNLVQQLTEELTASTKRAQDLQHILDELFTIAYPGAIKNALWARYQGIEGASPSQTSTLYWHPSEMYTARLAYGNDTPLWGSERLEVLYEERWIAGKAGHVGAASGMVLWPREKVGNPEYITLTVGSVVRNVSKPVGDGGGPE